MRFIRPGGQSFFASPYAVVYLLIATNVFIYGLCIARTDGGAMPAELLLRAGAMYSFALSRHEYWRLVAYGFLHADLLHLTANMICLALWGGHLEKRIGSSYFLVIYFSSLIAGATIENAIHFGPYLAVGASGAISGVLGALLSLWILGRINLSASFFVINIGLNIALATMVPRIGWGAHVGGFAAGMILCALLDIAERANAWVFRCKFPEFAKFNFFVVVGSVAFLIFGPRWNGTDASAKSLSIVIFLVTGCAAAKLLDLVLSLKKGLVIVVLAFAAVNAAILIFIGRSFAAAILSRCASVHSDLPRQIDVIRAVACGNPDVTLGVAATCIFALTLLLYSQEIRRGMSDVGFVGASLRAERKRNQRL